jgi:pilus assembly protein Flp/PilA
MRASLKTWAIRFLRSEDGVTMLEYTILLGIITVAVIASVVFAGNWVSTKWAALTAALS